MVNTVREVQARSGTTQDELIRNFLSTLIIIDYGIITGVYEHSDGDMYNGVYIDVRLITGGHIENVEVLFLGNIDIGVGCGDRVIVFGTKKNISDIGSMLSSGAKIYSDETVKALPLGSMDDISATRLIIRDGVLLFHKNGVLGIDGSGAVISRSMDDDGHATRDEAYAPDGSFKKVYNGLKAVEKRNEDYSNEWTLYDDDFKIIEHEKRDMGGGHLRLGGENTGLDDAFEEKKWKYKKRKNIQEGYTVEEVIKDGENKILCKRVFNLDGSFEEYRYEQSEDGEDYLLSMKINADGSFERTLTDGSSPVCVVSCAADGTLVFNVGDGKNVFEMKPDGSIAFKNTSSGLLTIGNSIATLGGMVLEMLNALVGLHTEGSPASHTASVWAESSIRPILQKWQQVFD
jgi:hypothetical protein